MAHIDLEEKEAADPKNEETIRTIYEKCRYESIHGLQIPVDLYKERVMYYTNISRHLLESMVGETNSMFEPDLFDRAVLSDTLKTLYLENKSFTFNDIYEIVKTKVKVPEIDIFCRILRQLGYKPVNTLNRGQIIIEDPKFTFERFRYLNKIRKCRNTSKTVYYIDERIIDLTKTFKKPWVTHKDISQIEGYIFFHIVSKNGLEKGLFCNKVNAEDFYKWVSDIVLSYIKTSSIIVMDNNPLHGTTVNEAITRYHSKTEMLSWLHRNNIPCSPNMRKAHLYDLIERCPVRDNQYQLDLIFKSHGHEVLRLPQNYHDLSLTELLWEHIRSGSFNFAPSTNLNNLKNDVYNAITSLRQEKWSQFESIIIDTEKNIFSVDENIEDVLLTFEVDTKDFK